MSCHVFNAVKFLIYFILVATVATSLWLLGFCTKSPFVTVKLLIYWYGGFGLGIFATVPDFLLRIYTYRMKGISGCIKYIPQGCAATEILRCGNCRRGLKQFPRSLIM